MGSCPWPAIRDPSPVLFQPSFLPRCAPLDTATPGPFTARACRYFERGPRRERGYGGGYGGERDRGYGGGGYGGGYDRGGRDYRADPYYDRAAYDRAAYDRAYGASYGYAAPDPYYGGSRDQYGRDAYGRTAYAYDPAYAQYAAPASGYDERDRYAAAGGRAAPAYDRCGQARMLSAACMHMLRL